MDEVQLTIECVAWMLNNHPSWNMIWFQVKDHFNLNSDTSIFTGF